jgi:Flp pilus assembly protein TadD
MTDPVAVWRAAVAARPLDAVVYCGLATALWQVGEREEAVVTLREALRLNPTQVEAHNQLATALAELGDLDGALALYRSGLRLAPAHPQMLANFGNALMRAENAVEAEAAYRAALHQKPDHVGALNNLGNALMVLGRPGEALAQYEQAHALLPQSWGTQNNIATALLALHRPTEAEAVLRRVLEILPDYAQAANNLGGALLAQDRLEEAAAWFEHAIGIEPSLRQAVFGLAMARLGMGDFAAGWDAYESRWDDPRFAAEHGVSRLPIWRGEDIGGARILLTAEQGFGDTIQFARYAALVARRGATPVLAVQPALVDLLRPLAETVPIGDEAGCAWHCPLLSLPHRFATTLATIPPVTLTADPSRVAAWRERLGPATRKRIGLVISGDPTHSDDAQRSLPAAHLAPLLALEAEFHLLQPDLRDALASVVQHDLTDFSQTAALASLMDLVISVDTAGAHLAASLGIPTWILLPHAADWRWLRGRGDSPWYPTVRLFRQSTRGDWGGVIAKVRESVLF